MEDVLKFLNDKSNSVYATAPVFATIEAKKLTFLVDKRQFLNSLKDCTVDQFSPWTGVQVSEVGVKSRNRTYSQKYSVRCSTADEFVLDVEGDLELRLYSNAHPLSPQLTRKVAFVLTQDARLCSHIYYCYDSETALNCSDLILASGTRKRKKPSEYAVIKEALVNRTVTEAKKFLIEKGITVTSQELSSLSRSVPSHVKTRRGRKPPSSTTKLIDRFAAGLNKNEFLKPVDVTKNGDKVSIIQLVAYPTAIAHYVKVLPYLEDLLEHQKNLEIFRTLPTKEAELEFGKYISSSNASGSLPLFGSSIFIDTTFSVISGEFLTLAVAITDQFKTASGKNSSFLLAVMIHTQKTMEAHEKFSAFLNECLAKESLQKRVPSIIHDGEASFRVYQTGLILKDAVVLRCDIHRSENIKSLFKKNTEAFREFKVAVFGKKKMTPHGVMLKSGLLGVLSRSEFDRKLNSLILSTDHLEAKNWLIHNAESLFHTGSLIKKLEGGWPCQQYLTTNVIESRNSYLKDLITSEVSADTALNELLKIHEDEMRQRKNAIIGEKSTLITEFRYPHFRTLVREQQINILKEFGLDKNISSDVFQEFPCWLSSGDGKMHRDVFLKLLDKIVVYPSGNVYFTEADNYITKIVYDGKQLLCSHPLCKKHRDYTYVVCVHMLSVFLKLENDAKHEFVEAMDIHRNSRTFEQVRFKTQTITDGSNYTSRRGLQFSKQNHPRTFDVLSRLSLNTTIESDLSLREYDDENDSLNFSDD